MATIILNISADPDQIFLTSQLSVIRAHTDKPKIDVSLSCTGSNGSTVTLYSSSLYAFDGMVELTDAASIIEEYFRQHHRVIDTVTVTFDTASVTFQALYCEYSLPDTFDAGSSLLLATKSQRVHQDSTITIAHCHPAPEATVTIKAVGHTLADDTIAAITTTRSPLFAGNIAYFSVADIIQWAISDDGSHTPLRSVMYFALEYAGTQKMFYIVPAAAYHTFSFRNIFNVPEYIDIVGDIVTKTDVSRDSAVCSGRLVQYDRAVTRSYEITTEAIPREELPLFEQLLASHEIKIHLDGQSYDILITDQTCEPSTSDEQLANLKFTWRFAHTRPHIFSSAFDGIMPSRRRIFDDTFSPEYE